MRDMPLQAWAIFILAAVLEVGGDATIRFGLQGSQFLKIMLGALMLGFYGLVVNLVKWDFSKLLGVYVAAFTLVSFLFGRFLFGESIPPLRWVGLGVVFIGCAFIQCSSR